MFSFRCDANQELGYGHLSRCLTLANELKKRGEKIIFLLRGEDVEAQSIVSNMQFSLLLDCRLEHWPKGVVVFDLAHDETLKASAEVENYFHFMRLNDLKSVWIDSMGSNSAVKHFKEPVDIMLTPYLGAEYDSRPNAKEWLAGAQYAILPPDFSNPSNMSRTNEKRLLLTMGGSDPWMLTEKILSAFVKLNLTSWKLRVIIGPFFKKNRVIKLRQDYPEIEICENRIGLLSDYYESNAVVAAAGLTRYEIAALGLPGLLISPTDFCRDYLSRFQKMDIANVLFVKDAQFEKNLLISLHKLLTDIHRVSLTRVVDGNGCRRVAEILVKLKNDTK